MPRHTVSACSAAAAEKWRSTPSFPVRAPAYNPRPFAILMVRLVFFIAGLLCAVAQAAAPPAPRVIGKAWIVGDVTSGQVLLAEKADERIEPASLTKLMTAYLVFAALHEKKLTLEQ